MITFIGIILIAVFLFLSGIHFYWGFGGKWGTEGVFPTKPGDEKPQFPGSIPPFIVALILAAFSLFYLIQIGIISYPLPEILHQYGLKILAGIFSIRAIGEFNYIGFFKKHRQTLFGQKDTKYYSPLCLLLAILTLVLDYGILNG